ncbi:hypothetical protein TEA_002900 [Camellia sinensis var. sinensis]|uniref:AP2/ERF domain-containing protein n=1 Tax=Camellia sinensis var. sinensis TaxID=542762 RepID=A0A4S4DE28_CAMSN|nr:hypothetical protein TEA_002900 [Camellia sinensis var. sinensis]
MAKISQQNRKNSSNITSTSNNKKDPATKVKRTRKSVPRDSPPQRSSVYRGVTSTVMFFTITMEYGPICVCSTQEEAATAYDMAAIEYRGLNAVTNFDLSRYIKWLRPNQNTTTDPNNSKPNPNPNVDINPITNPSNVVGLTFLHHHQQSPSSATEATLLPPCPSSGATASSALGLLLQSSKFKEMLERTSVADCLSTPPESDPPRSSFPDDIQTYFDCQNSGSFVEEDDIIFGDLNSFSSSMFQCEIDA